jgi:hypothetical protein
VTDEDDRLSGRFECTHIVSSSLGRDHEVAWSLEYAFLISHRSELCDLATDGTRWVQPRDSSRDRRPLRWREGERAILEERLVRCPLRMLMTECLLRGKPRACALISVDAMTSRELVANGLPAPWLV